MYGNALRGTDVDQCLHPWRGTVPLGLLRHLHSGCIPAKPASPLLERAFLCRSMSPVVVVRIMALLGRTDSGRPTAEPSRALIWIDPS
jgi:hypothetical protein